MTDDIRFDRDMQTLLEQLPEEQLPAARVTPWRQAMRCVLWGIGLTSITLNFWNLQHLLPMVGSILLMLGFRTLRQENGCLRSCWRLSIAWRRCGGAMPSSWAPSCPGWSPGWRRP